MMEFYVGAQKVFCDIGKRSGRCERPIGLVLIYRGIEPPESRLSGGVLWLKIKSRIRRRYAATFFDKVMVTALSLVSQVLSTSPSTAQ